MLKKLEWKRLALPHTEKAEDARPVKTNTQKSNDLSGPSSSELFDRLSDLTTGLTGTCAELEHVIANLDVDLGAQEQAALQNLDRMTQNLFELSALMKRLAQTENQIAQSDILAALQGIGLPSMQSFLADGTHQEDQGSVDLF
jgi:hypothetical protein